MNRKLESEASAGASVCGVENVSLAHEITPLVAAASTTTSAEGEANLKTARHFLYVSHFFAQFSECVWQFALILMLGAVTNYESLTVLSTYGLAAGLAVCLFGATTGRFVDRVNRLKAAQWFIWTENVCVLLATCCCYFLLSIHSDDDDTTLHTQADNENWFQQRLSGVPLDTKSVLLLIGIHLFGPIAKILDKGFLVAIERDWVVVMSQGALAGQKTWLSETNVAMKQIDLSCRVAAPAVAGFVIAAFDTSSSSSGGADGSKEQHHYGQDLKGAAILVGAINVAALAVEYICTAHIYTLVPALAVKVVPTKVPNIRELDEEDQQADKPVPSRKPYETGCGFFKLPQGLSVYLEQPVSWSGLGLAMLYLNSLSFGALMTAYLVWRGMRLESVGIWRGISSVIGLAGTFVYHASVKRMTVVSTGMWSICYQFTCLSLCFASLFVNDFDQSMAMLIAGACASRIGLWVFDISVTQLMQEFIPDGIRGVVGGTQQSLNAFFQLLSFAVGLVFPDPRKFHINVAAGYSAVGVAAIMYALGVYRRQDIFLTNDEKERRRAV